MGTAVSTAPASVPAGCLGLSYIRLGWYFVGYPELLSAGHKHHYLEGFEARLAAHCVFLRVKGLRRRLPYGLRGLYGDSGLSHHRRGRVSCSVCCIAYAGALVQPN